MAKLSADGTQLTVEKGDTLSQIAVDYKTTVAELVKLNRIANPDYIVVGQVLNLKTQAPSYHNFTYQPIIRLFGLQSNTDRTLYVTWAADWKNIQNYRVLWEYDSGDGAWWVGSDSTTQVKQSLYSAPSNAIYVRVKVYPNSQEKTVNGKTSKYFYGTWSTTKKYTFGQTIDTPGVPTITVEGLKLTARVDGLGDTASIVEFEIYKDDAKLYKSGKADARTGSASKEFDIVAGGRYKARCRTIKGNTRSEWSNYTSNIETIPLTPTGFTKCEAKSETSIYVEWAKIENAKKYDLEYATKKSYFGGSDKTTTVSGIEGTSYEKTGLSSGDEYFFRLRAVNDQGSSGWSEISSATIGTGPAAPTTWSSTTTAVVGEPMNLYWVHNSKDGSSQTFAELELIIDGVKETHTIENTDKDTIIDGIISGITGNNSNTKTSVYPVDTSKYTEGTKILWRVKTAGVTKVYGEWSIQRTVDIYAKPVLEMSVTDAAGQTFDSLTSFPFYISGIAWPNTQRPVSYHVTVTSNDIYETVDSTGVSKMVNAGEEVYSKHFDISDQLMVEMSAGNIDLENNMNYTIKCVVSMNSGLTAEATKEFEVGWADSIYSPNAEIILDEDSYYVSIRPYCEDANGDPLPDVVVSLYRREFDGTFKELTKDLDNTSYTYVTDPHPSLDYARYRVVAKTLSTGAISYYDIPAYPIGCKSVILQWDEDWAPFSTTSPNVLSTPSWAGSMLKLPYNIDVSDNHKQDVALIEYIGRKHPVSYYGSQLGETATWSVTIPKSDTETLYGLRRLASWMGDVYVREPSGTGYWANVTVSFSQKHKEVTIPVTINITRVEGGV